MLNISGGATPSFSSAAVVNASGYQNKLAPGAVFVIFGAGLGHANLAAAAAAPGYPASVGGTSVTFTPAAGGAAIDAGMVYSLAGQISGVLPSSIPPGNYAVRVTYNGATSAPQNVMVVARSFGIASANSSGSGVAQATIGNVNGGISLTRFTTGSIAFNGLDWTLSPARPGDTVVLWGTGGGADLANDTGGTSGDQTAAGNIAVLVSGREIRPLYAGASSGYPGLWQINFTLPADIITGCSEFVQVRTGTELSNGVLLPIADPGQNSCTDPNLPPAILAKIDAGGPIIGGGFAIARLTDTTSGITQDTASGFFGRWTAAAWLLQNTGPKFGYCTVYDRTYPLTGTDPASPSAFLNAGTRLPLNGPGLASGFAMNAGTAPFGTFYAGPLAANTLAAGTYALSGTGGADVGAFSTSTTFPGSFQATNFGAIASIDRSRPLTLTWSGSGFETVYIQATTSSRQGSNVRVATINCYVPGTLGSYAIPVAALSYLQPAATTGNSFGALTIQGTSAAGLFTAPLTAGGQIDFGRFVGNLGVSKNIAVQ